MSRELMDHQGEAGTVHPATWAVYSDSRHPNLQFLYWFPAYVGGPSIMDIESVPAPTSLCEAQLSPLESGARPVRYWSGFSMVHF